MSRPITSSEYKDQFGVPLAPKADPEKALGVALEVRKFEIELYWKRAAYFWVFLAGALGGYLAVLGKQPFPKRSEALLTISCLGFVLSVAWYFVNRASKFWQENWEKHVDLLEDAVHGPLYKTVLHEANLRFWRLNGPYPFSVSKINQLLSLFAVLLFFLLAAITACCLWRRGSASLSVVIIALTLLAVAVLWCFGRTDLEWKRQRSGEGATLAVLRKTKIVPD